MFKIAKDISSVTRVTKKWLDGLTDIKNKFEGKTYIPTSDGSLKLRTEGHGLEKFKGFKNPENFKNKSRDDVFVNNINIPHGSSPNKKQYSNNLVN